MTTETRAAIADSRAQYFSGEVKIVQFVFQPFGTHLQFFLLKIFLTFIFSDFTSNDSDSSEASGTVEENGKRKPSYVGLSHSVNGYTPYAPYNGRQKKISPPLQVMMMMLKMMR